MNISIIGGGAWGTTLALVLSDNQHQVMIYDINQSFVDTINHEHKHPIFNEPLDHRIQGTSRLEEAILFSDHYILCLPTKVIRPVLKQMNPLIQKPSVFVNVSKGIEPETLKRVSQIVEEEIDTKNYKGFVVLTGPSHAEEVILRKLTLLVSASEDEALAKSIQTIFANEQYLRIYTSSDLIGCEVGGAVKNAIAVISGVCTGLGLGENARAAVISRGIVEIVRVVVAMGGKKETAFGLTGIGDLIVTASSENSRNFQAGKRLGQGDSIETIYGSAKQTIEGIRTIEAMHHLAQEKKIELPMIETAYEMISNQISALDGLEKLLARDLKSEGF